MYGYDPAQLEQFITQAPSYQAAWGHVTDIVRKPYTMQRWSIQANQQTPMLSFGGAEATLYIESGAVQMETASGATLLLESDRLIHLPTFSAIMLRAPAHTVIYLFGNGLPTAQEVLQGTAATTAKASDHRVALIAEAPSDYRDKYWGDIRTLVNGDVAGKRLFLKKGNTGSLEFHVQKHESYYVHSGVLALLLRAGRAENRLFTIPAGTSVYLPPGLMHQRGALEDTVIIEISTRDSDSDSFLVEDGTRQPMNGFKEMYQTYQNKPEAITRR